MSGYGGRGIQGSWFPSSFGYFSGVVRAKLQVDIDINGLTPAIRKKLRDAVNYGYLPSRSGKLSSLYESIAVEHNWPTPHLWTRSQYTGAVFWVSEEQFNELAPFLVAIIPEGTRPKYVRDRHIRQPAYGTVEEVRSSPYAGRSRSARPAVTSNAPQIILEKLKSWDKRDQSTVEDVLARIDALGVISLYQSIT